MSIAQTGSALRSSLVTTAVIVALLGVAYTQLPKSFSDDLGRIGRGASSAVLIHNKNSVQSQDLMTLVNRVRPDYAGRVEFLVAEVDTETGRVFLQMQQLGDIALVLFGPDGTRLRVVDANVDEQGLRAALNGAFGYKP